MLRFLRYILLGLALWVPGACLCQIPDVLWKSRAGRFGWGDPSSIVFSPDGSIVAVGVTNDSVSLYRTTNGALVRTFKGKGSPAFSPDGTSIALVGENGVNLWSTSDGQLIQSLAGSSSGGLHLGYSPDGRTFAAGFGGVNSDVIQRWEMPSGMPLPPIRPGLSFGECLAFSPDGNFLAAAVAAGVVYVWDAASAELVYEFTPERIGYTVFAIAFSPDSKLLAGGTLGGKSIAEFGDASAIVKLWSLESGKLLRAFTNDRSPMVIGYNLPSIKAVCFSPDNKLLLAGSENEYLLFWRVADGALLASYEANDIIWSLSFSPDSGHYAYAKADNKFGVANCPLWLSPIEREAGRDVVRWQGGSGFYQLQFSTTPDAVLWQNIGAPTSLQAFTNSAASTGFYRVRSLVPP